MIRGSSIGSICLSTVSDYPSDSAYAPARAAVHAHTLDRRGEAAYAPDDPI
jgi:hypothetical protein